VRFQELLPGRPPLALRCRLDPMLLEDVRDRAPCDVMMQVGEGSMDSCIAPVAILCGHPHQLPNLGHDRGPARAAPSVAVVLPRDQLPMPRLQSVGAHDRDDVAEHPSSRFALAASRTR
jgi:hypothetical protein